MSTADSSERGARAPLWIRRPGVLHVGAYSLAAVFLVAQIVTVIVAGSPLATVIAVAAAGVGLALSWWAPWPGLVVTSAASFAVTAFGIEPVSVWMMAVIVLFSFTLRGRPAVAGTAVVAAFFFAGLWVGDGFGSGALVASAALFTAVGGGAMGAALRLARDHWLVSEERTQAAITTREREVARRVTEERLRIARDLHDVVGHQAAMLSVHLGVAEIGLPEQAVSSRRALESARSNARNVVTETQRILTLLRREDAVSEEDALRPTPSLGGLGGLIASFESIGLDVTSSLSVGDADADPVVEVTVYRVLQEALTNAYRHGEGPVEVGVHKAGDSVLLRVSNLIGHSPREASGGGLGLVGMRERVESCGGRLTVGNSDGRFLISAEFSPQGAPVS